MATVVSIMDRDSRDQRTDNIVVVDLSRKRLLWVPRDLWCERLGDRVNEAFGRSGHQALIAARQEPPSTATSAGPAPVTAAMRSSSRASAGRPSKWWMPKSASIAPLTLRTHGKDLTPQGAIATAPAGTPAVGDRLLWRPPVADRSRAAPARAAPA